MPHEGRWDIYPLDLATQDIQLIYGSPQEINASAQRLSSRGKRLLFAQNIDGASNQYLEICTVGADGKGFRRLTDNAFWDLYPAWSPDDGRIAFPSLRRDDLGIHVMDADGANASLLCDSGSHDADVDWMVHRTVFTANDRTWSMSDKGASPTQVTDPPRAGQRGGANLPLGDYDPRLSPDGARIVFERLEGDSSPHGNYDIYTVNADGTGETRLTADGYSQGLASWSHAGDRIVEAFNCGVCPICRWAL